MNKKIFLIKENPGYYLHVSARESGFIFAFTTRKFNYDLRAASTLKEKKIILLSRRRIFESLGLDPRLAVFPEQVHRSRVSRVTVRMAGHGALDHSQSIKGSDAMISALPQAALCMLSADCLPVAFFCPRGKKIGLAHAGWRGLKAKIVFKTASRMRREFSCDPGELRAYIGPGICAHCYEVDGGMKRFFPEDVHSRGGRYFLDLKQNCTAQLVRAGISPAHIFDSGFCTKCARKRFFSFRGQDRQSRMLTIAAIL